MTRRLAIMTVRSIILFVKPLLKLFVIAQAMTKSFSKGFTPRPARIRRDPGVPPRSALPGPAFGPARLPPSPRRLRENPRPNPRFANPDNADRAPAQTRARNRGISHVALINEAAEYQDPLTFQEVMRLSFADDWRDACQYEIDALAKNGT